MKMSIYKELTAKYEEDTVREDMKEFKESYTDGDLLRMFQDALDARGIPSPYMNSAYITACNIKAFPAGTDFADEYGRQPTHYEVKMTIDDGCLEIDKIRFYTDNELNIDLFVTAFGETHRMYSLDRYTLKQD